MTIFDKEAEQMDREELAQLQLERLQALVVRLKRNVRRYREQMSDERIETLADLERLPLTTPEDLARSFPYGMFALPLREVIRLHSMVGPGGKPLVTGHTRNDLVQWGRLVARQLVACGVTANEAMMASPLMTAVPVPPPDLAARQRRAAERSRAVRAWRRGSAGERRPPARDLGAAVAGGPGRGGRLHIRGKG